MAKVSKPQKIEGGGEKRFPMFAEAVQAGFPSPAEDYIDVGIDLNEMLVKNPTATYFVRVKGDSMVDVGINSGDVLIVDKAVTAKPGDVVVASVDNEFTVKKLIKKGPELYLVAANESYAPIKLKEGDDLAIWGVVTNCIKEYKKF